MRGVGSAVGLGAVSVGVARATVRVGVTEILIAGEAVGAGVCETSAGLHAASMNRQTRKLIGKVFRISI